MLYLQEEGGLITARRNLFSRDICFPVEAGLLLFSVLALYLWGSSNSTGRDLSLSPLYGNEAWLAINYFKVSEVNLGTSFVASGWYRSGIVKF